MYLNFREAFDTIQQSLGRPYKGKPDSQANCRISQLISTGELERFEPEELFVKSGNEYLRINAKTSGLVTLESVNNYIEHRKTLMRSKGISRANKPVVVIFSDGSKSRFHTKYECCQFFGIDNAKLTKFIKSGTEHEITVPDSRVKELGLPSDIEPPVTESVSFKYASE